MAKRWDAGRWQEVSLDAERLARILGDRAGVGTASTMNKGDKAGNGGDVVDCREVCEETDSKCKQVELLDLYEGRVIRDIALDLGDESLTVEEKIELALSRIDKFDPGRAELYRLRARSFFDEALFLSDIELVDISDSDHVALPKGCRVSQIAIQKRPEFPEDPYYILDEDLWKKLNADGKAGLILHEVAYREAIAYGHDDSTKVRYLVQKLTSDQMGEMDTAKWAELRRAVSLPYSYAWEDMDGVRHLFFVIFSKIGCGAFDQTDATVDEVRGGYPGLGDHLADAGILTEEKPIWPIDLQRHRLALGRKGIDAAGTSLVLRKGCSLSLATP